MTLQKAVLAEKQRRAAQGEVQYITESQLQTLVEQDPGSDIRDYEDLQTGTVTSSLLLAAGTILLGEKCIFFCPRLSITSHQLLDRDWGSAALPRHQSRPVYPLLPVSRLAV